MCQINCPSINKINQSAGSRNQNLHPIFEFSSLKIHIFSSEQSKSLNQFKTTNFLSFRGILEGKFTCRNNNKSLNMNTLYIDFMANRNTTSSRFPRPCFSECN